MEDHGPLPVLSYSLTSIHSRGGRKKASLRTLGAAPHTPQSPGVTRGGYHGGLPLQLRDQDGSPFRVSFEPLSP